MAILDSNPPQPVSVPSEEENGPWRIPPVTRLLIGSTVAVFVVQLLAHLLRGDDPLGNRLAFSPDAWAGHQYWTLLTYAWAHAVEIPDAPGLFWLHLLANMVLLFSLGPALEELLGPWRFLALYLGGTAAAALVWLHFSARPGDAIIGASGAAFALIAAAGTAAPRARVTVYLLFLLPIPMNLATLAGGLCGVEAASVVFGWMPYVGHTAHLGGAVFGFLFIMVLRLTSRLPKIAD